VLPRLEVVGFEIIGNRGLRPNDLLRFYVRISSLRSLYSIALMSESNQQAVRCRGVRGATTADGNTREEILQATRQLLALMIRQNGIDPADVASAIFTTTVDLDAEFPALAARQLGWLDVALLCNHELDVPGSLRQCIRVMLHWNTAKPASEIMHVYVKGASVLRPDLCRLPPVDWDELESWIDEELAVQSRHRQERAP
jgi:chorismate mutase